MTDTSHRASISPADAPYTARVSGVTIAQTAKAKVLQEVNGEKAYRPVIYFPLADIDPAVLTPSDHRSHCPIKGDAGYYTIKAGGERLENAAWYYPVPLPMVAAIEGHVAFYPDKVTVTRL